MTRVPCRLIFAVVILTCGLVRAEPPKAAGDGPALVVQRQAQEAPLDVPLAAVSRPLSAGGSRPVIGTPPSDANAGVRIDRVTPDMPAAKAGLKEGDVIVKMDGNATA